MENALVVVVTLKAPSDFLFREVDIGKGKEKMGWIHIQRKVNRYRRVCLPHRSGNSGEKGETRTGGLHGSRMLTEKLALSFVLLSSR